MHKLLRRRSESANVLEHYPSYAATHVRIEYLRAGLAVLAWVEARLRPDLHKVRERPSVGVERDVDVPEVHQREVRAELEGGEVPARRLLRRILPDLVDGGVKVDLKVGEEEIPPGSHLAPFRLGTDLIARRLEVHFVGGDALHAAEDDVGDRAVHHRSVGVPVLRRLDAYCGIRGYARQAHKLKVLAENPALRPEVHRGVEPVVGVECHQIVAHLPAHVAREDAREIAVEVEAVREATVEHDVAKRDGVGITDLHGEAAGVVKRRVRHGHAVHVVEEEHGGDAEVVPLPAGKEVEHAGSAVSGAAGAAVLPAPAHDGDVRVPPGGNGDGHERAVLRGGVPKEDGAHAVGKTDRCPVGLDAPT